MTRKYGDPPVTSNVGVLSLVILSVLLTPVSLTPWRSGADGDAGGVVLIVSMNVWFMADSLPAASTNVVVYCHVPSG